jgi:uncharacterized protein (TIGR00730 family)
MKSLTVYCSSSRTVPKVYFDAAAELGAAIASHGWTLIYGGNAIGPMGHLADAVRSAGGKVVGITPRVLVDEGVADQQCQELLVTESLRQRKELMEQRGDAFLAMPGGLGTLEELFEIIVARQLHAHDKPIVLLNIDNYYAPLLAMIDHGIERQFIRPKVRRLYFVATTVAEAVDHLYKLSVE